MQNETTQSEIIRFNIILKRYDQIYRNAAKNFGLPYLSFLALYVICQKGECTQKDIAEQIMLSKQSINSAVKSLEESKDITFFQTSENKKEKLIRLTKKGKALAKKTVIKVLEAENKAFDTLTQSERENFLELFERVMEAMKNEAGKIK